MCGIAGIAPAHGSPDRAILDRLRRAIGHRGPDGDGITIEESAGEQSIGGGSVGLVHTRLAIVDLATGDQPIRGPDGLVLVANGEIYNDPDLRAAMADVSFTTRSDCEPPLHLYRRHGLDFARHLRGMYAIAIFDPARGLVLARDPFGIKPIYYVENAADESGNIFAFASEPQALIQAGLAAPGERRQAAAELLQLKFSTGAETIFPGIMRMLPGETLLVRDGRIVERRLLPALPAGGPRRTAALAPSGRTETVDDALAALDRVLADSVQAHLRADVPYGLFLSSGIDSSAVAVLMARLSASPVVAMTVGFPGTHIQDESGDAQRLARAVGAEHHMVTITPEEFWTLAPKVALCLDDPTTDAAALPTYRLGEAARGNFKVALCGEGADELFGGYSRYRRGRFPWTLLGTGSRRHGVYDKLKLPEGGKLLNAAAGGWRDGLARAEAESRGGGRSALQAMQATDCAEWLPNDLLVKLDRCLMANAVEGRTPFLDPRVAEFAFRLPDRMKRQKGFGKWLLREWLARAAPEARPFARKLGFGVPVGGWIATRGKQAGELVAAQPGVAALADPAAVKALFANAGKHGQAAWNLLFYALWHSLHVMGLAGENILAGADALDILAQAAAGQGAARAGCARLGSRLPL